MADDAIIVDVEFKPTKTKQNFSGVENQAEKAGLRASAKFSEGFSDNIKKSFAGISKNIVGAAAGFFAFSRAADVLTDAAQSAVEFEKSIVEINTILPKNTKLTEQQTKALREYSKQFGSSATAQAKSFYSIISAGVTDTAKANKLLEAANKLAIGGLTDVGSAIDILTTIINGYGAENITAQEAADSLFTAVRLGKTTVDELASSLGNIVPGARAAGVELDVANAAVAQLTANGNTTSIAVTKLNALLGAFARNGEKLGKGLDLAAIQSDGFIKVLQRLETQTGGSSDALFKLLGSSEAVQAAQILMRNQAQGLSETYGQFTDKIGAADMAFEKMGMTADQQFKVLNSQWNEFKLTLGEQIVPVLLDVISKAKTVGAVMGDILGGNKATTVEQDLTNQINEMTLSLADLTQKARDLKKESESNSTGLIRGLFLPGKIKETNQEISEMTMNLEALKRQRQAFRDGAANATNDAEVAQLRLAQGAYEDQIEAIRLAELEKEKAHQQDLARVAALMLLNEQVKMETQTAQELFVENSQANFETLLGFFDLAGRRTKKIANEISKAVFTSISGGVGRAFEDVGKALANGQNAFQAFADGIKNVLADVASSIGDVFIKWGVANLVSGNYGMGGAQIAAGAALKVLGGFLGGGSSGGTGGGSSGSASTATEPITVDDSGVTELQETAQAEERVNLNLNIEGSFVRESEVNGYISDLLEEGSNEDATIVPSLRTGF